MNITPSQIESAINEAELAHKPTSPASTPVTIRMETLGVLISAAKDLVEFLDETDDL